MKKNRKLGEILVANGLISEKTLQRALERQKKMKKKLGIILEEIEVLTAEELAGALADQHGYKLVTDIARYGYPPELLALVPVDTAMQSLVFPLKRDNERIAIAMADPTETRAVAHIGISNGLKVIPFIATKKDIITAIARHYLGSETLPDIGGKKILVIEHNRLIATMVGDILRAAGYQVTGVGDGMAGYRSAVAAPPHLILCDAEVPGIGVFELFDSLRNLPETGTIPVILLTSSPNSETEARAFETGFFDFITKPVTEVTLLTRVKRALLFAERGYQVT